MSTFFGTDFEEEKVYQLVFEKSDCDNQDFFKMNQNQAIKG